ncbi:Hsp70 family protein [candidate division KSB1 bacterium]|nr:Hsp70 family protein [candidate division KSB1 bacterium]
MAVMNPTDSDIVIHRDKVAKRETTPSCVWKDPKTTEIVVGHKAFGRIGTTPKPIRSIKRSMGNQIKVKLTDRDVTPEEVSAYILEEMKKQIEEDVSAFGTDGSKWIVDRAIITVPAYFDQPQIDATREAGKLAGLKVMDLLHEPTAAACHYCWRTGTQNGVFLVYDFGGGTFDVSVLRSTAGAFEVLGISGNNRLGGDDIDTALAQNLQERLLREGYALELNTKEDVEDELRFDVLKFLAEGAKKALSSAGEFLLRDTNKLLDKAGNPVLIETMYERPEFEELIRPIVERTIPYCHDALEKAQKKSGGVTLADVDEIILAGGSTHIPLVREIVQKALCSDPSVAEPRAKCKDLVYEKVDTIVALGAAIRAAAVGGLTVYNPERTIGVSFRGTATTGSKEASVGGKVETADPAMNLSSGKIRLTIPDSGYQDESEIKEGGAFAFRKVPLQASAQNLLTFEVFDRTGKLLATAGRQISQSREAQRPTGGASSTAVLSKAISLEVMREGKEFRKDLFPVLATLPANEKHNFSHPGNTELIRLPLYQLKRKIKEIQVPVDSSLPKGTPVEMTVNIDERYFITVQGKIGEKTFEAAVEPPPPREMPKPEDVQALDKSFNENVAFLPTGKKGVAEVRYKKAKKSFESAAARGDNEQAIHDFEEMEEIVASISRTEGALQPPKEFFDDLVKECHEINTYVARAAAEAGHPHDHREVAKSIEAQRVQGEKAIAGNDQKAYTDTIIMLETIRNHVIALAQKVSKQEDNRTESEKAEDHVKHAGGEANKAGQLAAAQGRKDYQDEIEQIKAQLKDLTKEAQKNPRAVQEKIGKLRARLSQIVNVLMGKRDTADGGKLVEDIGS